MFLFIPDESGLMLSIPHLTKLSLWPACSICYISFLGKICFYHKKNVKNVHNVCRITKLWNQDHLKSCQATRYTQIWNKQCGIGESSMFWGLLNSIWVAIAVWLCLLIWPLPHIMPCISLPTSMQPILFDFELKLPWAAIQPWRFLSFLVTTMQPMRLPMKRSIITSRVSEFTKVQLLICKLNPSSGPFCP